MIFLTNGRWYIFLKKLMSNPGRKLRWVMDDSFRRWRRGLAILANLGQNRQKCPLKFWCARLHFVHFVRFCSFLLHLCVSFRISILLSVLVSWPCARKSHRIPPVGDRSWPRWSQWHRRISRPHTLDHQPCLGGRGQRVQELDRIKHASTIFSSIYLHSYLSI